MANAQVSQFLGLNEDIDTQLKLGEATTMQNFRVTTNLKLKQIEGYGRVLGASLSADKPILGQWHGKIGATYFHLVACDGHIYKIVAGVATSIGTLTAAPTFMFQNSGKVYFMNGVEYKSFDGTTFGNVTGYIPTIAVATPPAGGGTTLEGINLLTGFKRQRFNGDGTATSYVLREQNLSADAVVVTVGTTTLVEGVGFTVNRTTGIVTPTPASGFVSGTDNITITWNKTSTANRSEIEKCRKAVIFGTRVHVWGNTGTPNARWHSGLDTGITSAEYFPATQITRIGPNEYGIMDIVSQYDRQVILTDGGMAFYSYYEDLDGIIAFPVFDLSETTGQQAFGQAQVLDNFPVSIQDGVYRWVSTGVRDERNAQLISQRVKDTLATFTLSDVITCDWEQLRELWIAHGDTVLVYNYQSDVWYKFVLHDIIKSMIVIDGKMYFGNDDGMIYKFDTTLRYFDLAPIEAEWEMGYYDWGQEWLRKFTNQIWVTMEPGPRENLDVYWVTDRMAGERQASTSIGYNAFSFSTLDFDDWTFNTSRSPRPKRVRTKAKKFAFWKLILRNSRSGYRSNVLSITFEARIGGNVK